MEDKNKSSTFLTSGEGFSYEDHIGAFYLSSLHRDGIIYGLHSYQIEKVSFQQANMGDPLDDFVIEGTNGLQKAKLSLQAKHNISFGSNKEFINVIKSCAGLFKSSNFNINFDKFGIIVGVFNKSIDQHYKKLNELAINSTSGNEFEELINNQSVTTKEFYKLIKAILLEKQITDISEVWDFCKSFLILYLQHSEPSGLGFATLNNINELTQDIKENQNIYNALLSITNSCRIAGGSIDKQSLVARLREQGISLMANPTSKASNDFKKIEEYGKLALNNIKQDIKGIAVEREKLLNDINNNLQNVSDLIMLIGTEGTGKSAILKNLVAKYKEEKNCIVFSDKFFSMFNEGGWQGFSNYLKLDCSLDSIIYSLIANGKDIYVFVDGIDFINEAGKKAVLEELVSTIKRISEEINFTYKIITTGRLNSNPTWLVEAVGENNALIQAVDFPIEQHIDFLDRLNVNPNFYKYGNDRFKTIFSNLFMLEIFSNIDNPEDVSTEWDIAKLWWNRYIIEPELKTFLMDFGEKLVNNPTEWQNISQDTIANKLLQNMIFIKNDYEYYYTGHDIYRDWLISLVFDSFYSKDIDLFKSKLPQLDIIYTNYYLKPFAIFASRLITNNLYEEWLDLYEWSTRSKLLMWQQALLESVLSASFNSNKLYEFLNNLVEKDEILKDILDYLYSTKINFKDKQFFVSYNTWRPFVCWFANNASKLYFYEEIHKIFGIWRYSYLLLGDFYFSEIADVYKHWLTLSKDKNRDMRSHRYVWYKENEIIRELIFLAVHKPEYIEEELQKKFKHHDVTDVFLLGMCPQILIDRFPQLYSDFIFNNVTYSLEELEERSKDWHYNLSSHDGANLMFEGHILNNYSSCINYKTGPFSYFLEKEEAVAINLIQKLANHAINGLLQNKELEENPILSLNILGENYNFYGEERIYYWFRPSCINLPILNLAFVSLENYLRTKVQNGEDFNILIKKTLSKEMKNPITLLGIAISLGLEFPDKTKDVLIDIVTEYQLWHYDIRRQHRDQELESMGTFGVSLAEEEIKAFDENKNREHRKLNVRDGYIPYLLADKKYRDTVLTRVENWIDPEDADTAEVIPYYKVQVKLMDAGIHSDQEKITEYSQELENLNSNNKSHKESSVSSNYIILGLKNSEEIKNISKEELESVFDYIEKTFQEISNDSMVLSSLLKFLVQVFTYKMDLLQKINRYNFCVDLVYKIVNADNSNMDPIYISSIIHSLTALLGIKIYYEIGNYDRSDLNILYKFLSLSVFQRLGYTKDSAASILFGVLNELPVRGKKYNFYINLLDFVLQASITKRKYLYSSNETRAKYESKRINSLAKTHLKLNKTSLFKIKRLNNSKDTILEDFLPSLLFTSRHFKFFNAADKNFSKIYECNLEKILSWNIDLSKIGYEERRHSEEYSDWYQVLCKPIFNLQQQYSSDIFNKYIGILIDNKKYVPNLLGEVIFEFFNDKHINKSQYVSTLRKIFNKILEGEKVDSSTEENLVNHIVFCSYGLNLLEDNWTYFSEFTQIIDKWVKIYGGDWHYYSVFLTFVKHYHSKYPVKQILEWLDYILNHGDNSYDRLFEHYGINTLYIMQLLKKNYDKELQDKSLKRIFVDIVNKLVTSNITTANELQQSLL